MSSDIYVTLLSNSCVAQFPNNNPRKFRNKLCTPINLTGEWEVALEDLSFPFKCFNLTKSINIEFSAPCYPNKLHDVEMFQSPSGSLESTPIDRRQEQQPIISIETIRKSGVLARGYYRTADELGSAISALFHDLFNEQRASGDLLIDLDYDYSEVDNKFKFAALPLFELDSQEHQTLTIVASDWTSLGPYLGLDRNIWEAGLQLNPTIEMTPVTCNVPNFIRLYVCSDVIEYQQFAGTSTQLLAALPIDHSGRCECKIVPRFLSLRQTTIESIEIEIMSNIQLGSLFPIPQRPSDYDYVKCTMHFRRKSMLQSCI